MGQSHYILKYFVMRAMLRAINAGVMPGDLIYTVYEAIDDFLCFDPVTAKKLNEKYFSERTKKCLPA